MGCCRDARVQSHTASSKQEMSLVEQVANVELIRHTNDRAVENTFTRVLLSPPQTGSL